MSKLPTVCQTIQWPLQDVIIPGWTARFTELRFDSDFKRIDVGRQYVGDDTGELNCNFYWTQGSGTQM